MLCIRASGVSLVTKTKKDTSDMKSHLSSLTVSTSNLHVSTVVTAEAGDVFAQQQRPLPCSRLISLSDHTLECEAPLWGKRGTGCLVSMSPQSEGLTPATTTLQRIIKSKRILRKSKTPWKEWPLLRPTMLALQPCTWEELGMAWIFLCPPFHFLLGKSLAPSGWSVQLQIFGIRASRNRTTVCLCAYVCERTCLSACTWLNIQHPNETQSLIGEPVECSRALVLNLPKAS